MKQLLPVLVLAMMAISLEAKAQAPRGGSPSFDFRKKTETKESSRWTLQEWLAQKDRNMMMDLWLGMYAPSPYEFFAGGSYLSYDRKVSTTPQQALETSDFYSSGKASVGAYALIMGLEGEYENNNLEKFNDVSGSLNLRVLGNAVQGTHLILHYGLRTRTMEGSETLRQQFAGADLNLYLMKYFGLQGLYRVYLPEQNQSLGIINASRSEAGVFIDFGPLRLFGNWFSEIQVSEKTQIKTNIDRTGIQSGLKFFF